MSIPADRGNPQYSHPKAQKRDRGGVGFQTATLLSPFFSLSLSHSLAFVFEIEREREREGGREGEREAEREREVQAASCTRLSPLLSCTRQPSPLWGFPPWANWLSGETLQL
jgi:hypothetical protein